MLKTSTLKNVNIDTYKHTNMLTCTEGIWDYYGERACCLQGALINLVNSCLCSLMRRAEIPMRPGPRLPASLI